MEEIKRENLVKVDETCYVIPITILTGEIVQQLGERFVFDASTLIAPESCALDYNHNDDEIIGRCDSITVDKLTGEVRGVATFIKRKDLPSARVNEVLANLQGGVPYEVSPFIDLTDAESEIVDKGAAVHGREESGSFTIWRGARIRGVAICPHGADGGTSFVALKFGGVQFSSGETEVSEVEKTREIDPELTALIEEFGKERGLDYYLEGFTVEEARADDYEQLKALREEPEEPKEEKEDELEELSAQVSKLSAQFATLSASVRAASRRGDVAGLSPSAERDDRKMNPLLRAAEKFARK